MNERSLFVEALEQDGPIQRSAFLDTACAGDAALRQRVEALLKSHVEAGNFLDKLAPQRLAEDLAVGQTTDATQDGTPSGEDGGDDLAFLSPTDKPGSLGRLGHYDIQEVVGRGGMGIVLRAFDERLHRVVAIKVMAAQLATSATARKRFTREAQAAAAVSHDHVVTIHAVEEANGRPYIAMQYVAGMSLQERLDRGGPLELHEILRIGMQTASGLVAAHAQGLIHRDIKPANILLENGVERVKITDFGLARAAAEASLTQSGAVAGTPHYMAPEQARGDALDARTDLFSLGSVLYAMCTGRSPFRASGSMAVLKRVCEGTPTPIRETNPEIPDWLTRIIDKLHAKDPAERFQSAAEVAELLSRHLAHVQHPSVVPLAPLAPWGRGVGDEGRSHTRPRRRLAVVAAAALILLLGGLSLTEATGVTQLASTVIRILTPDGTLSVEVNDPAVKITIEGDGGLVITGAGPQEVRLKPGSYRVEATKDGKPVKREVVTITRGGKQVVNVSMEDQSQASASQASGEVRRFEAHTGWVWGIAWSPDGKRVAYAGQDCTVWVCDVATGKELGRFVEHQRPIRSVVFSSDGRRLLSGSDDETMRLWDAETGKELRSFKGHKEAIWSVALSPDGRQALSGSGMKLKDGHLWAPVDYTVRLWNVDTGEEVRRFPGHKDYVRVAFSPDGKRALTGGGNADPVLRLFDVESGQLLSTLEGHSMGVIKLVFSADGRRALSASTDHTLRLWDLASGKQLQRFHGHQKDVSGAAFLPEGQRAISCSWDRTVRLWDLETGRELHRLEGHTGSILNVEPSPDGRYAVSGAEDGTVRLWKLPELTVGDARQAKAPRAILEGHGSWIHALAFSPDGKTLATGSNDQHVRVWDTKTGDLTGRFHADEGLITSLAYSPDGTILVSASNRAKVRVWDAATFNLLAEARHDALVRTVAFRRGDAMLATASDDKTVKLWKWDGAVLVPVRILGEHSSGVAAMSFNPQGTVIACATGDGMLYLWDVESGELLTSVRLGWQALICLAFSPDGRTIAAGGYDKRVELRKADTLESLGTLRGHKEQLYSVVFLPDGKTLVSVGGHFDLKTQTSDRPGELKLWDVADLKERLSIGGYEKGICSVALSPDGKTLATGDLANLGRLWDVDALLTAARAGETARASAAPQPHAFVLLGGEGVAERKFGTLADAVQGASDGDTIEVRGNGPFVSQPINIARTVLRIKAGDGFRPVIQLSPEGVLGDKSLLATNAALVLEGLELQRAPPPDAQTTGRGYTVVHIYQGPLRAANCQFRAPVWLNHSPVGVFRNCDFAATLGAGGRHRPGARVVFENCLHRTKAQAIGFAYDPALDDVSIQIKRNTFVGGCAFLVGLQSPLPVTSDPPHASRRIRLDVSENILDAGNLLGFDQTRDVLDKAAVLEPAEAEATLQRLIEWRGERNLFAAGSISVVCFADGKLQPPRGPQSLEEWKRFGGSPETDSQEASPRFHGGNIRSRTDAALDQLTPEDFRLRPDSPGYRAGPDGKDLGADVDLVGPGAAYERWKKTPEYQQWVKETGQQE